MEKPRLVIWGAAGHAMVVADIVRLANEYVIAGFLDDINQKRWGESFCQSTIVGGEEQLSALKAQGVTHAIVAFGNNAIRLQKSERAIKEGFQLATLIHPRTVVARDSSIGPGTVIAAAAVVNCGAKLGKAVIVNTAATVDHECVVQDGAHIGPGVHIAGRVTVGALSWIGIGASIRDGVRIGAEAIVGAGAAVLHDIPDKAVAYGVPAKIRDEPEK